MPEKKTRRHAFLRSVGCGAVYTRIILPKPSAIIYWDMVEVSGTNSKSNLSTFSGALIASAMATAFEGRGDDWRLWFSFQQLSLRLISWNHQSPLGFFAGFCLYFPVIMVHVQVWLHFTWLHIECGD